MRARRFLLLAALAAAVMAVLVAGLNAAVDPYLVLGRPRQPGFNQVKPAVDARERLMKAYEATRRNPATVVLGSSRSGVGLDPASTAWPAAWQPVYNLSTAGAGAGTSALYLAHLLASHGGGAALRQVVVGLDFEAVLYRNGYATTASAVEHELQARFAALAAPQPWRQPLLWQDHLEALLTLDALGDSLSTLLANRRRAEGPDLLDDGRLADDRLRRWTRNDSVEVLFHEKNRATLRAFAPPRRALSDGPGAPLHDAEHVQRLLDLAARHHCRLLLLVQPSHVFQLELLQAMGYGPDAERWKRGLTAQVAAARAAGVDVELWDFLGYEDAHTEPMPPAARGREPLHGWWDPVHYRRTLGDALVRTLTGQGAPAFGARLTPATVDDRLAQVRRDRAAYLARRPAEAAALRALVCPGPVCGDLPGD